MRVTDITEQQINEAPTSRLGNFAKKIGAKAAGAVGMSGTAGRLGGGAEVGTKANELYKSLARWQGINGKNDKNMTAADVKAWAAQDKVNVSAVQMPNGVLPKNKLMDIMKKVAASELTGGNVGAEPASKAQATPQSGGGGAISKAIDALQKTTGKAGVNNTPGNAVPASDEAGSKANQQPANVKDLKNKEGIPPNIQTMLDKLTPTEKKALAGAI